MKKKLLVTASTFPRWEDDTEPRFVLDLSKALLKYFDVTVLVPAAPGAKDREVLEGVKVIRYHYFPIHKWETLCYPGAIVPRIKEKKIRGLLIPFLLFTLWRVLNKNLDMYDLVHAHWIIPQGIVQAFFKTPYLLTGHGGDVTALNKFPISILKKHSINNASEITVVSNALKNVVAGMNEHKKISVIPMGCDIKKFSPDNREENFFDQNGKKVVLFVGRLAEKKGVRYLIEAMETIDAILIIVGSGPLEYELKKQSEGMGSKIQFWGAKTHSELPKIYASADLFVAPSITAQNGDKEGVPTTIVEAMASGIPVIGTNHSGIPELICNGENGFLVEEKDVVALKEKIDLILTSDDIRKKFIKNGLKTAQSRSFENIAKEYASLLNNIS